MNFDRFKTIRRLLCNNYNGIIFHYMFASSIIRTECSTNVLGPIIDIGRNIFHFPAEEDQSINQSSSLQFCHHLHSISQKLHYSALFLCATRELSYFSVKKIYLVLNYFTKKAFYSTKSVLNDIIPIIPITFLKNCSISVSSCFYLNFISCQINNANAFYSSQMCTKLSIFLILVFQPNFSINFSINFIFIILLFLGFCYFLGQEIGKSVL